MPETRPDIKRKRATAMDMKLREAKAMHAEAADLERRAASVAHTIAVMQAEQITLMIEAAMLRQRARDR